MFESLTGDKETRMMENSEEKARQFQREQDTFKQSSTDDQTYFEHQAQRTDLIRWQQELDDELDKLKHRLRSEVFKNGEWESVTFKEYDKKKKQYVFKTVPPLCNDLFIEYLEVQLLPFLSRSLTNSNLDEKRILKLLLHTCNDLTNNLADHYDTYNIEFTNFDVILRMIKNMMIPAAFKSLGGWTKKIDSSMVKRIEAYQEQQQDTKKGLLSGVFS